MAHKIRSLRDIGQIQCKRFSILVHDNYRYLSAFSCRIDAVSIRGVRCSEVDLNASVAKICSRTMESSSKRENDNEADLPSVEPISQTDGSFGIWIGPVRRYIYAVSSKNTQRVHCDKSTCDITISSR
jgi:hypothetical protein